MNLGSKDRLLVALNILELPPGLVPRPLLRWEAVIHPAGGKKVLLLLFTLGPLFRISGKEYNLICLKKIFFPLFYDFCSLSPPTSKRIEIAHVISLRSKAVRDFKRGSHVSGNHIRGRETSSVRSILIPAQDRDSGLSNAYSIRPEGIPSAPGEALSYHLVALEDL